MKAHGTLGFLDALSLYSYSFEMDQTESIKIVCATYEMDNWMNSYLTNYGQKGLFLDFLKLFGLSFRVSVARRYAEKLSKNRKFIFKYKKTF
jgi:hypothetical protein